MGSPPKHEHLVEVATEQGVASSRQPLLDAALEDTELFVPADVLDAGYGVQVQRAPLIQSLQPEGVFAIPLGDGNKETPCKL